MRSYEGSGGTKEGEGRGVLDEFYTPKPIVDKMWGLVKQNLPIDLEGNLEVLEPSAGTGRFIESAPTGTNITAYETNPISAKIAKVLNPEIKVVNKPFEDVFMDEKGGRKAVIPKYDVVIGNPPYGIHRGKYKGLGEEKKLGRYEEYFIKRALDLTKENGIVAMIVPSGFLRGKFDYAKGQIAMRGDLVDAYRLPNKSFKTTDIGTDILIIKKHDYLSSADQVVGDIWANDTFFKSNPEKVLGTETEKSGKFGMVKYTEGKLDEALGKIDAEDVEETRRDAIDQVDDNLEQIEQEQPLTAAVRKEAVKKALKVSKEKTKKQKKGDNNSLYERDPDAPYILQSVKKDGTKIFLQGGAVEHTAHVLEDGSIDARFVDSLSPQEKSVLNFQDGKYYNDFNYLQGDIYDKLDKLNSDIASKKISEVQFGKQKAKLEKILPEPMGIKEMTILPIDKLASEIRVSYNGEKDRKLQDAFSSWLEDLPYDALEGSSSWEVRRYLEGLAVRGGSKEQNLKEKNRRRRVANKLFKKFYTEELSESEQAKITDRFNKNFNGYVRPDYREYPLSIELNSQFYGNDFELKEIQKEGAAFLVNKGVGLLGYEVGVGKTLTAISAIAEVMKKGWAKRPLIVVPKNLKSKWIQDLMESMPGVKINDLSNLGGQFKYKGEPADLEIEDGSLSIITEDGFKRIGYTPETYEELTRNLKDVTYKLGDKSKRDREIESAQAEEIQGKAMKGT
ncbi:MAG TPA: N-6 DNA methylase, partial [Candidatus Bathyarchaeia archaeon]|nr:N-6 DNA methylase [Candidatus Bathyarchaeia archaeon]